MEYTRAREALRIAREKYDLDYPEIAIICGVSLGMVKEWMLTGKAQDKAIEPLIKITGKVYLTASQVAEHLLEMFNAGPRKNAKGKSVRRFSVTDAQLAEVAGRKHIKKSFLEELIEELRQHGLLMNKGDGCFVVVSWEWLASGCTEIQQSEIHDFYANLANDIEAEFDDRAMETSESKPKKIANGMGFNEVRDIVGDEIRFVQPPGSQPKWPRNQPKMGTWILTGKEYADDNSATFVNFNHEFNVDSVGRASFR